MRDYDNYNSRNTRETRDRRSLKRKQAMQRRRRISLIVGILILAGIVWGIVTIVEHTGDSGSSTHKIATSSTEKDKKGEEEIPEKPEPITLTINCIGDIMMHSPQTEAMYGDSGELEIETYFSYVKPLIEKADLSLCNLESPMAGPPYLGYPLFSVPDEFADEITGAGFDVIITANNHILDQGLDGMIKTAEVLKSKGIDFVGSRLNTADKDYLVLDIKGVKVGVIGYTYETTGSPGNRTMNGSPMSEEAKSLMSSYIPGLESDYEPIKKSIADAKQDGAEIVVAYFHWGEEYQREPNASQREVAQMAADNGADIIFASHPHVIQPMEMLDSGGKKVPVYWSMGNYISNQRAETLDNKYTEQGIVAEVSLTYDPEKAAISHFEMSYIPLWVDKYHNGKRNIYAVIPLVDGFQDNPTLGASGNTYRAEGALADIEGLVGSNLEWTSP